MISVENVHGTGLGCGEGRMMEDAELEEGEAGSYRHENEYEEIDPDVAFSYIGERLYDLLGHHQKEFEGDVTAENLGPKYGAYGSFLPTNRRLTTTLQPMVQCVQVQNQLPKYTSDTVTEAAPNNFGKPSTAASREQYEFDTSTGANFPTNLSSAQDLVNMDSSPKPTRVAEINTNEVSTKAIHNVHALTNKDASMKLPRVEGANTQSEDSKQSNTLADRKPIKIRIKMNSNRLLPRENATSTNDPGITSSLVDSDPTTNQGVSLRSKDDSPQSPNDIIRSMTTPVPIDLLLSPLPGYLKCLTEKGILQRVKTANGNKPIKKNCPAVDQVFNFEKHNSQKRFGETGDAYKDIFGEMSSEDVDNKLVPSKISSELKKKNMEVPRFRKSAQKLISKGTLRQKNQRESLGTDKSTEVDSSVALHVDNANAVLSLTASPGPILDDWVECDRCKKWRLLPFHLVPGDLPEQWTCSLINWLPGMNCCDISEEETTRAVLDQNHVKVDVDLDGTTSKAYSSNTEKHVPVTTKKNHGSTKMSGLDHLQHATTVHPSKASSSGMEKIRVKIPKKAILFLPDGGDTVNQRTEIRRKSCHGSLRTTNTYKSRAISLQGADGGLTNNKRKVRGCSETGQHTQVNRRSQEDFSEDYCQRKKARLDQLAVKQSIHSEGYGKPRQKDKIEEDHVFMKEVETDPSEGNINVAHPHKKISGFLKTIVLDSSTSKISSSQKLKTEVNGVKVSPLGSVSLSPPGHQYIDRNLMQKKSLMRDDDLVERYFLRTLEDESLRSKSYNSCTISGSKEYISSGEKQKERKKKKSSNNGVNSCKGNSDADSSYESIRRPRESNTSGHDVQGALLHSEQVLAERALDKGSPCRFLAKYNQMNISSKIKKLPSGPPYVDQKDNIICQPQHALKSRHSRVCASPTALTCDDDVKGVRQVTDNRSELGTKVLGDSRSMSVGKGLPYDAAIIEKEARNLKYVADRFGDCGSAHERVGMYFQSALKFLLAASLFESSNCESTRHDGTHQALQIYHSTTKLFDFCAAEFLNLKNECAAALAYKCVEVACLRIVYSSHSSAARDRHELETALRPIPPGESPSSYASDVDNLNIVAIGDHTSITKNVPSPLATGGLVIPARNRPNLMRFLNFTQVIDLAMESSQKSQTAFMAASGNLEKKSDLSLVKKALQFSFQDVGEFLRLVRFAIEAISG